MIAKDGMSHWLWKSSGLNRYTEMFDENGGIVNVKQLTENYLTDDLLREFGIEESGHRLRLMFYSHLFNQKLAPIDEGIKRMTNKILFCSQ